MRAVWKYPLDTSTFDVPGQAIEIPTGAVVRFVDMQGGSPTMWAEIDDLATHSDSYETRWFRIVGTGHPEIDDGWMYVGSVIDGVFSAAVGLKVTEIVWHVYEIPRTPEA